MVKTNDDRPEFPDEISTSSKKAKHCFSLQPCRVSSVHLSEELLYEVFLRLPVKSLIRFRSVSKGMRRLIDSSIFIKNHNIHRSVTSERARSLSVDSYSDDDEEYAVLLRHYRSRLDRFFSLNFDNNLNRGKAIELNCNFAKEGMFLMGWCCNGIFALGIPGLQIQKGMCFGTPLMALFERLIVLPVYPLKKSSMGYDIVNDDYKIIGFIKGNNEPGLQVYSLRKDSWGKLLHRDFPSGWACYGPYGVTHAVCVSGVMHWMWTNGTTFDVESIFIVAFNLATETFTSLPLPSEARQLQPCHFTDFRGRLCITFLPPGYPIRIDGPHTIWVMEKYGVESSWSKLYNFNIDRAHNAPNFYFPNSRGRLLCHVRQLCWWDPQDGSFERIEIPGLLNANALVYARNLVRLDQSLV